MSTKDHAQGVRQTGFHDMDLDASLGHAAKQDVDRGGGVPVSASTTLSFREATFFHCSKKLSASLFFWLPGFLC